MPQKRPSRKDILKRLEKALSIICKIDNQFPSNKNINDLYYCIYNLKKKIDF